MKQGLGIFVLLLSMVACSGSDVPLAKSTAGRNPTVAEVPDKDEVVRGDTDPAIVTLDLKSSLHEHRLTATDELPGKILIPTTNLNAVPITAALQAVLSGTDVSLSWNTGTLGTRLVTVMNLSGPLPKVVEKICAAAKVFCDYRHGSIELSEKETFVVGLPPIVHAVSSASSSSSSSSTGSSSSGSSNNSMVEAINGLLGSGEKATVDEQGGNIVYVATVDAEDRVSQYLAQLRTGRPLVVLQMYIWEVTLTRENSEGINWSQLSNNTISKSLHLTGANDLESAATTAGSVSLGAVTSGIISANAVASFLATKGRVQTISNPQVTFVSGSTASLKVGGTQTYISQVGTLTASNVSGTASGSTGSSSTNTVSTSTIDTGLNIAVAGSYENGVVFANLDLTLNNLVSLNPTTSGGGLIDLPQTTTEKMNTALRVRPGDSLVLAGLVTSADTNTSQGLPTGSDSAFPLYGDDQRQNHELVIIVKPSIVLFADNSDAEEAHKKETIKPLPDAVVIDKDGSRAFALPQPKPQPQPQPQSIVAVAPAPELMQTDLHASSMQDVQVAPSDDGAPVDKMLMQRGFSHAFDQLLQPPGTAASEGGGP
jgi:Flp pilus assembly secretin CpaC